MAHPLYVVAVQDSRYYTDAVKWRCCVSARENLFERMAELLPLDEALELRVSLEKSFPESVYKIFQVTPTED